MMTRWLRKTVCRVLCGVCGAWCVGLLVAQGGASASQRVLLGCDVCPEVVVVPGGTFTMGSPAGEGDGDEYPRRDVVVDAFAVGVWELTVEEFGVYLEDTGRESLASTCVGQEARGRAAGCISWYEAQDYIVWLSERTGARYRLLSEAEWEYVAAHASRFGVFELRGGVWEWVGDCWHEDYVGAPSGGVVWSEGGDCSRRGLRGGSWLDEGYEGRPQNRAWGTVRLRQVNVGMRVARSLVPAR